MNPQSIGQSACAPAGDNETSGGSDTAGTFTQAKQAITSTARETAARIKSVAGDTADRAKAEAQRFASETKDTTASRIGGYGAAIHESAKTIEQQDPNIAWATHRLAERVEGFADYLRSSDLTDMKNDVEAFARRHPVAFFGGLFLGGLVIGNLLKARQTSDEREDEASNWDAGNASGSEDLPESAATGGI